MRTLILLAALFLVSQAARAADGFPTISVFETYSVKQMSALPDVRVPLGRKIPDGALSGKSKLELSLMKNSIFAQVGYQFDTPSYRNYFKSRPWYHGLKYNPSRLKEVDRENARRISALISKAKDRPSHGGSGYGYGGGYGGYGGYGRHGEDDDSEGYGYGGNGEGYGGSGDAR